jgi:hypothetical protein
MLDGLDAIDWTSWDEPGWPAGEIPRHLRALASAQTQDRQEVYRAIYEAIGIDGYGAITPLAPLVVPFLYEMLAAPDFPDKVDLMRFLDGIAYDNHWGDQHRHDRGAPKEENGIGPAMLAGVPILVHLLEGDDPGLRVQAARNLATLGETTPAVAERVLALCMHEPDRRARFVLISYLPRLGTPEALPYLIDELLLGSDDLLLRWGAALSVAHLSGHDAHPEARALLRRALLEGPVQEELQRSLPERVTPFGLTFMAVQALCPETAVPMLIAFLEQDLPHSNYALQPLLRLCAPWDCEQSLTPLQRQVLTAFSNLPAQFHQGHPPWWTLNYLQQHLRGLGLPPDRAGLRAWLAKH